MKRHCHVNCIISVDLWIQPTVCVQLQAKRQPPSRAEATAESVVKTEQASSHLGAKHGEAALVSTVSRICQVQQQVDDGFPDTTPDHDSGEGQALGGTQKTAFSWSPFIMHKVDMP